MNAKMFAVALAVSTVGLVAAPPSWAQAAPRGFGYHGALCGCDGETQMVAALDHIGEAADEYFHRHFGHAAREVQFALEDLEVACHMVSSRHAQDDLHEAQAMLQRYLRFSTIRYLERASKLIAHALEVEQAAFRAGHGGHHHHGVVVTPAPPVVQPVVVPPRSGFSIQGRHFGLRVRF